MSGPGVWIWEVGWLEEKKFLLGFFCVCYIRPRRSHDESYVPSLFLFLSCSLVHGGTQKAERESRIYTYNMPGRAQQLALCI